ncbi:MAG: helix-turn-helix transcriptional regulator [Faecalibacterium sp.]|nr:helix-turn-helix transcriptional regulator [Ruminococcus sp.]MCM1393228.1 helix-turn-helix transcriptional regulator [Ruminococcus sp.]MCM1485768.1 helix-turn-helix transcriptional regulator [Faecalibacterium sp.]
MVRTNELVAARKRVGATQEDAAKAIGCSKNIYCAKENNKAKFDIVEAVTLCEYLNINNSSDRAYIFLSLHPRIGK